MNKMDLTQKIIYLPKLYIEQNVSLRDFLKKVGYFESYDQVTEKDIESSLTEHPDCIELWFDYSNRQKRPPFWFFTKLEENFYKVGFNNGSQMFPIRKFTDINKACAFYIKMMLERRRGSYLNETAAPKTVGSFRKEGLIHEIAYLPKHLDDLQVVNSCQLLKWAGYLEFQDRIEQADIEEFLAKNRECIKLWLQYSEDQRVAETWYFIESAEGSYEVAHNSKTGTDSLHKFINPYKACAFYIKKIVEDIRGICSSYK